MIPYELSCDVCRGIWFKLLYLECEQWRTDKLAIKVYFKKRKNNIEVIDKTKASFVKHHS